MSATLAGYAVTTCTVRMPAWGVWWADVEIDTPATLTGAVVLDVGGLVLDGAVVSGGSWAGRARYRIAAGAGRWGVSVARRSYANDLGVKLATVLSDAAADCGETFETIPATSTIGARWVREAGPASRQLALLAPTAWHVDTDGVTRLGKWPTSTTSAAVTVLEHDHANGRLELAADDLSGLVPGVTVDGVEAVDVEHRVTPSGTRTTIWSEPNGLPRVAGVLGYLVDQLTTAQRYRGVWSYRVVSQTGEKLDLQVERVSSGMPDLRLAPVRLAPGIKAEWTPGSMCLVAFVDGEASRYVVVAGDDPDSPGHVPVTLTLGEGLGRVLREGDTLSLTNVQAGGGTTTVATVTLGPGGGDPSLVDA